MSRVTFDITVLDHRDPITGAFKCRACGGLIPPGRKKYYCSDKCRNLVYSNFGWEATRRAVWVRDQGKCKICNSYVQRYDSAHDEFLLKRKYSWFKGYPKDTVTKSYDCHHIIPIDYLYPFIFELVREWFPNWETHEYRWQRKFNITWIIVYTDINNLITLCEDCHKKVHATEYFHDPELSDAANLMILELWAKTKINPWRKPEKGTNINGIVNEENTRQKNTLFNYIGVRDIDKET